MLVWGACEDEREANFVSVAFFLLSTLSQSSPNVLRSFGLDFSEMITAHSGTDSSQLVHATHH